MVMSFSTETKIAAAHLPKSTEEQYAMLYGMVLFAQVFTPEYFEFRTETAEVSDMICGLLIGVFDITATPTFSKKAGETVYKVAISEKGPMDKLRREFAPNSDQHIERYKLRNKAEEIAFIKGVFLACGYLNSPDQPYRLDFTVSTPDLAVDLAMAAESAVSVMPKLSVRKTKQIVYYRGSGTIVDLLNLLGLSQSAFAIMNSQIEREIKNDLNRKNNFDVANMGKTMKTAGDQQDAIMWLKSTGKFEKLPNHLKSTANLRLNNPEMSLEQLGEAENPPISKSQVSKRLKILTEMYERDKNKN